MSEKLNQIAAQAAHSIDLQQLANSIARGESSEFDKLAAFIRETLLQYDSINSKRLRDELIRLITSEIASTADVVTESMLEQIDDVIREEVTFQYVVLRNISSKRPKRPKLDAVSKAILDKPLVLSNKAMTWEERIGAYKSNQVRAAKQVIMAGWADGLTTTEISRQLIGTRNIRGVIQQSRTGANALAKDLISHASSMTRAEVARQNDDVVIGERVITTLDSRTSPICRGYSRNGGKRWLYSKVGKSFPRPPYHYNCRSVLVFIIAPEYDLELETTRPAVVDGKAIQVKKNTGWYELAKRYPAMAEQALGPTRAKLLKDMSADDFYKVATNSLGQEKTIDQMVSSSKKVASLLVE